MKERPSQFASKPNLPVGRFVLGASESVEVFYSTNGYSFWATQHHSDFAPEQILEDLLENMYALDAEAGTQLKNPFNASLYKKYDAFGSPSDSPISHYGYSGEETDLIYLRARYYDPDLGRFISADPCWGRLEDPISQNRFIYVHNNPISNVDPSGLASGGSIDDFVFEFTNMTVDEVTTCAYFSSSGEDLPGFCLSPPVADPLKQINALETVSLVTGAIGVAIPVSPIIPLDVAKGVAGSISTTTGIIAIAKRVEISDEIFLRDLAPLAVSRITKIPGRARELTSFNLGLVDNALDIKDELTLQCSAQ